MRLLPDTHVLLWALIEPGRLPVTARAALEATDNDVCFSAASTWEIAIKRALKRPDFPYEPETIRTAALAINLAELPIDGLHAAAVRRLPPLHRDPFDRILVAQAQTEPMTLVTNDPVIARYTLSLWPL